MTFDREGMNAIVANAKKTPHVLIDSLTVSALLVMIEELLAESDADKAEISRLKAAYQRASDNAIIVDERNSIEPGDPDWPPSNSPPQAGDAYNE